MDLGVSDQQEEARAELAGFLARECPTSTVRGAEPLGFDRALCGSCAERLSATADGPLLDAVFAAEEYGRVLAPIPVAEAIAARRVLRSLGHPAGTEDLPTLALRPVADGLARLVPAGAVASIVVARRDAAVVLIERAGTVASPPNLGRSPIADVDAGGALALGSGADAIAHFECAVDEWRVLMAALLVGLADGALALAIAHVSQREQFGVPIGSFQSVQHRLADLATDRDGARLLVHEAAWAVDSASPRASVLAAMAYWWSTRTAQAVATDSLHFHGGWGFTLERDPQLFLRRAKAWPLALGDPELELLTVADRYFGVAHVAELAST
jgi:alkylation response protein AidB-like acyl-CoA dehydrogenase